MRGRRQNEQNWHECVLQASVLVYKDLLAKLLLSRSTKFWATWYTGVQGNQTVVLSLYVLLWKKKNLHGHLHSSFCCSRRQAFQMRIACCAISFYENTLSGSLSNTSLNTWVVVDTYVLQYLFRKIADFAKKVQKSHARFGWWCLVWRFIAINTKAVHCKIAPSVWSAQEEARR